jgi:bacterioferritin
VAPASSQLRPVSSAEDLEGLLLANIQLENDLIFHYTESMRFCLLISDHVHVAFFKSLLEEEQQHAAELVKWLKVLQDS